MEKRAARPGREQTCRRVRLVRPEKCAVETARLADRAIVDPALDLSISGRKRVHIASIAKTPAAAAAFGDSLGCISVLGQRLFDERGFSRGEGHLGMAFVKRRRRGDIDGIDRGVGNRVLIAVDRMSKTQRPRHGRGIGGIARCNRADDSPAAERAEPEAELSLTPLRSRGSPNVPVSTCAFGLRRNPTRRRRGGTGAIGHNRRHCSGMSFPCRLGLAQPVGPPYRTATDEAQPGLPMIHYMTSRGITDAWVCNELRVVAKGGIPFRLHALFREPETYFTAPDVAALGKATTTLYPLPPLRVAADALAAPSASAGGSSARCGTR
jgi:hypothetical protein